MKAFTGRTNITAIPSREDYFDCLATVQLCGGALALDDIAYYLNQEQSPDVERQRQSNLCVSWLTTHGYVDLLKCRLPDMDEDKLVAFITASGRAVIETVAAQRAEKLAQEWRILASGGKRTEKGWLAC